MDGPTIVALVSVLVAGATSIAAPVIAGRNQRRSDAARFKHERAMRDTDELRGLLDQIAPALSVAIQKQSTLRSKHNTSGSTDANDYVREISAYQGAHDAMIHLEPA